MSFDKWRARLAGEKVMTYVKPDAMDEGYYRKPITQKKIGRDGKPNGQTETIGYTPVAYFLDGNALICLLGDKEVESQDEALWSWVVSNPISYELYRKVTEDGAPWPDVALPTLLSENTGGIAPVEKPKAPETAEEHKALIDTLIASTKEAKVETAEEANSVNGSMNKIAEARLAAAHAGEALYKPHFEKYKALYNQWTPMVKDAEAEEKRLARLILTFRESVRKRELEEAEAKRKADEAAAAAEKQRQEEEAERNARAADRAIASGEPEPEPEIEPPPPPSPPAPAPKPAAIAPTYGKRKVREQVQTFVEITDIDQVFAFFKETTEVKAVLHTLALAMVKAGHDVPGITKREGLI